MILTKSIILPSKPIRRERLFALGAVFVFCNFWFVSALLLLPRNSILDRTGSYLHAFNEIFIQGWQFFSPPPQANIRLYYVFTDTANSETKTIKLELFQDIHSRQFDLFNQGDQLLEHILSGAYYDVRTLVKAREATVRNAAQKKGVYLSAGKIVSLMKLEKVESMKNRGVRVLRTYARIVALENGLDPRRYSASFVGTQVTIPKMTRDRLRDIKPAEALIFQTESFSMASFALGI